MRVFVFCDYIRLAASIYIFTIVFIAGTKPSGNLSLIIIPLFTTHYYNANYSISIIPSTLLWVRCNSNYTRMCSLNILLHWTIKTRVYLRLDNCYLYTTPCKNRRVQIVT